MNYTCLSCWWWQTAFKQLLWLNRTSVQLVANRICVMSLFGLLNYDSAGKLMNLHSKSICFRSVTGTSDFRGYSNALQNGNEPDAAFYFGPQNSVGAAGQAREESPMTCYRS